MDVVVLAFIGVVFVLVAGMLVLVPVLVVTSARRARERQQGLAAFARSREWEYRPEDPALVGRFRGAPFERGRSRRATNVLLGRYESRAFTAFDYRYVSGSGEDSTTHTCSVIALNLGVTAPDLAVGPTTTLRRWVDALTGRDIEIGDPQFDAAFTVHSPSPEFARELLLSDVRDVLRHHPALSWRITGDSLLVIRSGGYSPGDVDGLLGAMGALLDRVPARVWERLGSR